MPETSRAKLVYEGSVKNLWALDRARLEFEYTDAYSVFDWGRMPDALAGKGESLAALGAHFFKEAADGQSWRRVHATGQLERLHGSLYDLAERELLALECEGLRHHFLERSGPNRLVVRRVGVFAPQSYALGSQTLHHYTQGGNWNAPARLIPLEVVFRFGMPQGSSLKERLTPEYSRKLGLDSVPKEGSLFGFPVLEFFTKLEDTDRFLTWEEALNYSGLSFPLFERLVGRTLCLAVWLAEVFKAGGLELWDGKFEWALIDGELALVDSIGPDELRILDPGTGTQISKEFLRLFYRKTEWYEAVKDAKKAAAADPTVDWKELATRKAGEPPSLSRAFREAADALYPSLALAITGENPGGLGIPLPKMLERIRRCLSS